MARPDPPRPDRRAASSRGCATSARCAASPPTRRSSSRRSSARPTTTTRCASCAHEGLDALALYERIAVADVQDAADVLRPCLRRARRRLRLARGRCRTSRTTPSARSRRRATTGQRLDRPNVMIKIPGTDGGRSRDRAGDLRGHQRQRHAAVRRRAVRRGRRGLHPAASSAAHAEGLSLDVHSVASFFVSRVDTEVDKRLEALGRSDLAGTAAVANARAAYQRYEQIFLGERFAALRAAGAQVQRPLWASTGTKNPAYSETHVRRRAGRARHRQHDADEDAAGGRRARRRSSPAARDQDPTPQLDALAAGGDRHERRHRRRCSSRASRRS